MAEHSWPPDVAKRRRRMCRTKSGNRKRRYTRREAEAAAARVDSGFYACPVCGWFHVGSVR